MKERQILKVSRKVINYGTVLLCGMAGFAAFSVKSLGGVLLCLVVGTLIRINLFVIVDIQKEKQDVFFYRLNGKSIKVAASRIMEIRNFRNSLYLIFIEGSRPLFAYESMSLCVHVTSIEGVHRGILESDFPNAKYYYF